MFGQISLHFFHRHGSERKDHRSRSDGRKQFTRILREQKNRGELRRLFQNFEQRIRRLFHECRVGENINSLPRLRRAVINGLNHPPHLIHFDHHLRRVGRDDQHIRMSLHEKARLFLVSLAQTFTRLHRFRKPRIEIGSLRNAQAVRASPAKIGQAIGFSRRQAIQGLRQHQRQRVLPRAARPERITACGNRFAPAFRADDGRFRHCRENQRRHSELNYQSHGELRSGS